MSIYPSLEDMKVSQYISAQEQLAQPTTSVQQVPSITNTGFVPPPMYSQVNQEVFNAGRSQILYPNLNEYLGLDLSPYTVTPPVPRQPPPACTDLSTLAPVTSSHVSGTQALKRATIQPGVSEVTVRKKNDMVGLRLQQIYKGLFIQFVMVGSPASEAGLRFGDQVLSVNDNTVAGWDPPKAYEFFKKCPANQDITMVIRDRPLERVITLHRDSGGLTGFVYANGCITAIVKESSAARNGVLTEHQIVEINGRNVIGLGDQDIKKLMEEQDAVTLTLMPSFIYDVLIKKMGLGLFKKMDHSLPAC